MKANNFYKNKDENGLGHILGVSQMEQNKIENLKSLYVKLHKISFISYIKDNDKLAMNMVELEMRIKDELDKINPLIIIDLDNQIDYFNEHGHDTDDVCDC